MKTRSQALQAAFAAGDVSVGEELTGLADDMGTHLERILPILDELNDVVATIDILGPPEVIRALNAFTEQIESDDRAAIDEAKDAFVLAARKSLGLSV